jgi:hypothetical protein
VHIIDLLLLHTAATWALVGLTWTIQRVQYPGFSFISTADFAPSHKLHSARITWIVAPFMACELISGLALLWYRPPGVSQNAVWVGMALIAVNWVCTAFVSIPLHKQLSARAPILQRSLVASNWVRTAAWSARGALTLFSLIGALGAT